MTPEQLDEIEKFAEAARQEPWKAVVEEYQSGTYGVGLAYDFLKEKEAENIVAFIHAMREYALPLVKAVREAREALDEREGDMHARIRAGYDKTVADMWREHCARIEKERDAARNYAENRNDEANKLQRFLNMAAQERDEARAELDKLREALEAVGERARGWQEAAIEERAKAVRLALKNGESFKSMEADRDAARVEIGRLRVENKFLRERPIPEGRIRQAMTGYVMDLRALVLDHEWVTDGRECLVYCLWCKQSESNGHAETCEMFGPGGLIPIDPKTKRPAPVKSLRERGCQCQWEEGDSACPVHGEEAK